MLKRQAQDKSSATETMSILIFFTFKNDFLYLYEGHNLESEHIYGDFISK